MGARALSARANPKPQANVIYAACVSASHSLAGRYVFRHCGAPSEINSAFCVCAAQLSIRTLSLSLCHAQVAMDFDTYIYTALLTNITTYIRVRRKWNVAGPFGYKFFNAFSILLTGLPSQILLFARASNRSSISSIYSCMPEREQNFLTLL